MDDSLDDIQYLVASRNRVRILRSLREGAADRRALETETGVSKATLGRVLGGFQDRGWVARTGHTYRLTPLGELLADEFTTFVDAVGTIQRLGDAVEHLPLDEIGIDPMRLRDATVTTPDQHDPSATLRRATELVRGAEEFRFLTNAVVSPTAEALREETVEGRLSIVGVITAALFEAVRESPAFAELTREMLEAGRAEFYRYDGDVPRTLGIADGTTAVITRIDEDGILRAQVETDDDAVRSWVESRIEECRRESVPITVEDLGA